MFEQPRKGDVDYALSMLMHEARRQVIDRKNEIQSEAIKHGALQSNRVIVMVVDAADKIHAASMAQAKPTLVDVVPRVGCPASEVIEWAKPHLENLTNTILGQVPVNGFPQDHQRLTTQYRAVFQQRVAGTLRRPRTTSG